jgi:hypothetical protein
MGAVAKFLSYQYDPRKEDRMFDKSFRGAFIDRPGNQPRPDRLHLFLQNLLMLNGISGSRQINLPRFLKSETPTGVVPSRSDLYLDASASDSPDNKPDYHRALARLARSMADAGYVAREP